MNEKFTAYLSKITEYLKNLDKKKKIIYASVLAGIVLLSVILVLVLNAKTYVVLYSGLETKECAQIVQKLDEMEIKSKVKNNSTIYVDEKDQNKATMQLAMEDFPKSSLNYDMFKNNVDFMTTDFEKTQYSLYQLQERLQASIKTIDDIENAIVTINVPNNSLAVLDEDKENPSASVLLNIRTGVKLSEKQINGITLLVANSVPGLKAESISIADQTGAVLNDSSADTTEEISNTKTKMENELSSTITKRIKEVLKPIYGTEKLSVGVNAVLDYNKKITEKIDYTGNQDNTGVIQSYDKSYQGAANGNGAGGVPGTSTNADVPTYSGQGTENNTTGNVKDDVSVDYAVGKMTEQIEKNGAEIKEITVSVIIDQKIMDTAEMDSIKRIVANVAGVKTKNVEIYNAEFNNIKGDLPTGGTPASFMSYFMFLFLSVLLLAFIFGLIFIIIKVKKKKKARKEKEEQEVNEFTIRKKDEAPSVPAIEITQSTEEQLKKEIKDFSRKSPEITAQLLRTLLKGEMD